MIPSPYFLLLRSTSTLLHHHHHPQLSLSTVSHSSSSSSSRHLTSYNLPRSAMETHSKDDPKMDPKRETSDKGTSDIDQSKKVSDDILPHILNLYGSRALPRDFEIYAPNASFEDPLMCARGVKQIKSAFYSLSKVFSESKIVEYSIEENILPHGRREILIDNKQYYKFMGKDIDMISLIKLYVENGKVIRHEDCWDKKPLWNSETSKVPLVGKIIQMTKRGSMFATHALMRYPAKYVKSLFCCNINGRVAWFQRTLMSRVNIMEKKETRRYFVSSVQNDLYRTKNHL